MKLNSLYKEFFVFISTILYKNGKKVKYILRLTLTGMTIVELELGNKHIGPSFLLCLLPNLFEIPNVWT